MKYFISLIFLLSISTNSFASYYFDFSPTLKKAYQKATSLQFNDAKKYINDVKEQEPENVLVHYVENYIDFLKIYIDEDYSEFEELERNKKKRLSLIKKGDASSPYYLYTQAEIRLQWAVARAKFEEYSKAALEVKNAYGLLEKNQKKFPDFIANKKSLGILHCLIGTVPKNFQWAVELMGMSGTIEQGTAEIKEVLDYAKTHDFIFEEETVIMYALLILHVGNAGEDSWKIIRSPSLDPTKNPLIAFAQASVAMHTGKSDYAIKILKNRPQSSSFHPFHYLDYMLGLIKLYKQDTDADTYLKRYVDNFKGRNYIKECYQRLAWHELLQDNMKGYHLYMQKVITEGSASIDGDKKALKAAKNHEIPNTILLKSRLLFDGGYLKEANDLMDQYSADSFSKEKEQLEFSYRKGRILQARFQYTYALEEFDNTIKKGSNKTYYFACNAALQAGIIMENKKDYAAARAYYNKCLAMNPSEYKSGLHAKAKAGKNRIKGK